jgi:hypothetical protein
MPDLELCDISMPIMSGFEVLERPNALAPRLGHIPFIPHGLAELHVGVGDISLDLWRWRRRPRWWR